MSYKLYINGEDIEIRPLSFSNNKQVNNIGDISERNSNFTSTIKAPLTANNIRKMERTGLVGNTSNLPYRRNVADLIDTDTGHHLVYKGWANLIDTTEDDYIIVVYEGIIDFYRLIEGLTMNDVGLSELNHIKNIDTIKETWTNPALPYRYNLADYNGKSLTDDVKINVDYQIPAASVKFMWDKVFEFTGYVCEGLIFDHEDFVNLWMSYSKPPPTSEPLEFEVTTQESQYFTNQVQYPLDFGGVFYGSSTSVAFLPSNNQYDSDYYSFANGVVSDGLYRFSFTAGTFVLAGPNGSQSTNSVIIWIYKLDGTIVTYTVNITNPNYIDIPMVAGEKWYLHLGLQFIAQSTPNITTFLSGGPVTTEITKIEGYTLGFDQAFIDYKVTTFIKEVIVRLGLTPFKDKYNKRIVFKTIFEMLQDSEVEDLSDRFVKKISHKTTFGDYGKRNNFKYKYNDDNMKHNDAFITIENDNLPDEKQLFESSIFSPERIKSGFLISSNIYKIWEKEVKDNGDVEYKDLDGRFYFMRSEKKNETLTLKSELLGLEENTNVYYRESYFRLKFQEILANWYGPTSKILNKARLETCDIRLSEAQINNFRFDRPYYIEQLSSYYLANKITSVKGRIPRLELIRIDLFTAPNVVGGNFEYEISIGVPTVDDCQIEIPFITNHPLPVECQLIVYAATFDVLANLNYQEISILPILTGTLTSSGVVSFSLSQIPGNIFGYKFGLRILTDNAFVNLISNQSDPIIIDGSCFDAPEVTNLEITNVVYSYGSGLSKVYNITFASDVVLPVQMSVRTYSPPSGVFGGWTAYQDLLVNANTFEWGVGVVFGDPTKFQIKIDTLESDEFEI